MATLNLLNDSDRKHLRHLIATHGLTATARMLNVSRGVVSSAVAGITVRRGSIELIRDALESKRGVTK